MALMLFVGIAVVAVVLLFLLWPRSPRIDITSFPRNYKEEKVFISIACRELLVINTWVIAIFNIICSNSNRFSLNISLFSG